MPAAVDFIQYYLGPIPSSAVNIADNSGRIFLSWLPYGYLRLGGRLVDLNPEIDSSIDRTNSPAAIIRNERIICTHHHYHGYRTGRFFIKQIYRHC